MRPDGTACDGLMVRIAAAESPLESMHFRSHETYIHLTVIDFLT
jgi:hypothetical protein